MQKLHPKQQHCKCYFAPAKQELNLSDGYAGTLVDLVVEYRNREDDRYGIDLDAQARQYKGTAQAHVCK
jgi:hypothetical protein